MSKQSAIDGAHAPDWESRSRPSKTKCADADISTENASIFEFEDTYRHLAKAFVEESREALPGRIFREISVSGDTRLRREAVRERRGKPGSYRAKAVAGAMQGFLTWFLRQEDLILRFDSFDMDAPCSFDKDAALSRYGNLCDLERGALEACRQSGDDLYTALLGITASHRNANEDYRCPADHWREMRESWHRFVRRQQQRVFDELGAERFNADDPPERWWEYVRIAEPHKSGFAHHHIAIVTNFDISVEMFEPVIAKHVETTPSANWEAHNMDAEKSEDRCVTVNKIDPESADEEDVVGNLASYLSGYLSEFDEDGEWVPMLEKPPSEVMFAAIAWATGSRKISWSNGSNDLRQLGYDLRPPEYKRQESSGDCPGPIAVRNSRTGEEVPILEPGTVDTVSVEDRPSLDPEKVFIGGVLEAT